MSAVQALRAGPASVPADLADPERLRQFPLRFARSHVGLAVVLVPAARGLLAGVLLWGMP